MPAKVPNVNAVNVLLLVPVDTPWQDRMRAALLDTAGQGNLAVIDDHVALLERRSSGALDWMEELAPPVPRTYNTMLAEGGELPLYRYGPIRFTVDLFNPGNEAGDPTFDPRFVMIELLVHRGEMYPWDRGVLPDGTKIDHGNPQHYARMSVCGEALGNLTTRWAEILEPVFACADMQYLGTRMRTATNPATVANPAPPETRHWDYLWSLSYWSPSLLTDRLTDRLKSLSLTKEQMTKLDRFWGPTVRPTWRELSTGGLLVQYRFVFSENRNSRSAVDTPLSRQAGLRTTNLIYRT